MNYDYRLLRLPIYDHSRVLYRNKIHLQTVSDEFEVLQEYII